jgi:glucose/arabinose dehydrogenase
MIFRYYGCMSKKILFILLIAILFGTGTLLYQSRTGLVKLFINASNNQSTTSKQGITTTSVKSQDEERVAIEVIADNLEIPWEVAFLPNGDQLVTERPGRLVRIGQDKQVIPIEGVHHVGEGGLLGLAVHPQFVENKYLYLYLTTSEQGQIKNRVERYVFNENQLSDKTVILENLPGANYHDGGRIEFGPDGYLYVTVGDAGDEDAAQDKTTYQGTILRIMDDGSVPISNPTQTSVYSYGHRNPQGLAWDEQGRLWSTEHGRSGLRSGFDEVNLIRADQNYGWPVIQGDETRERMITPVAHSGATTTWAPGDIEYYQQNLFFVGLRGEALYQLPLNEDGSAGQLVEHFKGEYGRLRSIRLSPDGYFYITTSNRDGRGDAGENDDKIIKVDPTIFIGKAE